MLVLAALLVLTLGVQYYLNLRQQQRNQQEVARVVSEQEQALNAAIALAIKSISSTERLMDIFARDRVSLLEQASGRLINILIVDEQGEVIDSLDNAYNPTRGADGSNQNKRLADVPLPKIVEAGESSKEIKSFLRVQSDPTPPVAGEPRAFPIRLETDKGANYILVVLGSTAQAKEDKDSLRSAARPLLPTLAVLLLATTFAALLVYRFTRPVKDLSEAARKVARGDFSVRVPAAGRRDEVGALAANFNEMTQQLAHTRELEARLNQVERSAVVGRLASAIAHEIRNPLNYINLTLDHLRTSFAPVDAEKRQVFERLAVQLKAEVARINSRITEFLNYTRTPKLKVERLNLRDEFQDALKLVEVQATESQIEIKIEQHDELSEAFGDRESLRSAFTNLIINALQSMKQNGRLTIELSHDEKTARIEISDTGKGIAPEDLSQIFEPYFSTKETGTGLGLAIVKKSIDDHGGTISVESKQNEGTTFTITLPINENPEARSQKSE